MSKLTKVTDHNGLDKYIDFKEVVAVQHHEWYMYSLSDGHKVRCSEVLFGKGNSIVLSLSLEEVVTLYELS